MSRATSANTAFPVMLSLPRTPCEPSRRSASAGFEELRRLLGDRRIIRMPEAKLTTSAYIGDDGSATCSPAGSRSDARRLLQASWLRCSSELSAPLGERGRGDRRPRRERIRMAWPSAKVRADRDVFGRDRQAGRFASEAIGRHQPRLALAMSSALHEGARRRIARPSAGRRGPRRPAQRRLSEIYLPLTKRHRSADTDAPLASGGLTIRTK